MGPLIWYYIVQQRILEGIQAEQVPSYEAIEITTTLLHVVSVQET